MLQLTSSAMDVSCLISYFQFLSLLLSTHHDVHEPARKGALPDVLVPLLVDIQLLDVALGPVGFHVAHLVDDALADGGAVGFAGVQRLVVLVELCGLVLVLEPRPQDGGGDAETRVQVTTVAL